MLNASAMSGKNCLITGGARGMGRETALALAAQGARVLLVDWQGEEGVRTRDAINARYGENRASFHYADLSSLCDVRRLCSEISEQIEHLDVLINNAGITYPEHRLNADGLDMHFAVCHLGQFALTLTLLPLLERAAPARVLVVSSEAHKSCRELQLDDLSLRQLWRGRALSHAAGFRAYAHAKLCNLLFMRELSERLAGTGISVNAVSPGFFVNTGIHREMRGIFKWGAAAVFGLLGLLGLNTAAKGARGHIHAASSPQLTGISGHYFEHCREKAMSPLVDDAQLRQRLWQLSEELSGCALPDKLAIYPTGFTQGEVS